eukprot:Gb_19930 [translate_table: standard]
MDHKPATNVNGPDEMPTTIPTERNLPGGSSPKTVTPPHQNPNSVIMASPGYKSEHGFNNGNDPLQPQLVSPVKQHKNENSRCRIKQWKAQFMQKVRMLPRQILHPLMVTPSNEERWITWNILVAANVSHSSNLCENTSDQKKSSCLQNRGAGSFLLKSRRFQPMGVHKNYPFLLQVTCKYNRKLSKILAWENTKKATAEASLRRGEEKLEKKKAAYIEKMRNKMASVHRRAEEKKAKAEVKKGEAYVKAEEMAAKYHIYGRVPNSNKWLQCCGR